jgi:uncharacterized protein YkwD
VPNIDLSREVLRLVNEERAAEGLSTLKEGSAALYEAALIRAEECLELFSHTRPSGKSCFTAVDECGVKYWKVGENLAAGQETPEEVVEAWMDSPGHRENIMMKEYTHLSTGIIYRDPDDTPDGEPFGYFWVQFFIQEK